MADPDFNSAVRTAAVPRQRLTLIFGIMGVINLRTAALHIGAISPSLADRQVARLPPARSRPLGLLLEGC
jgi:hypothetical protein